MIRRCEDCLPHLAGPFAAFDINDHSIGYLKCRLCGATYLHKAEDTEQTLENRQIILCDWHGIFFELPIDQYSDDQLWQGVAIPGHDRFTWVQGWVAIESFNCKNPPTLGAAEQAMWHRERAQKQYLAELQK